MRTVYDEAINADQTVRIATIPWFDGKIHGLTVSVTGLDGPIQVFVDITLERAANFAVDILSLVRDARLKNRPPRVETDRQHGQ